VKDMCNYGKVPGFCPLAVVESRRALKLFSDLALIILSASLFQVAREVHAEVLFTGDLLESQTRVGIG